MCITFCLCVVELNTLAPFSSNKIKQCHPPPSLATHFSQGHRVPFVHCIRKGYSQIKSNSSLSGGDSSLKSHLESQENIISNANENEKTTIKKRLEIVSKEEKKKKSTKTLINTEILTILSQKTFPAIHIHAHSFSTFSGLNSDGIFRTPNPTGTTAQFLPL